MGPHFTGAVIKPSVIIFNVPVGAGVACFTRKRGTRVSDSFLVPRLGLKFTEFNQINQDHEEEIHNNTCCKELCLAINIHNFIY